MSVRITTHLGPALMCSIPLPYRLLPEFEVRVLLVSIENLLVAPLLNIGSR